MNVHTQNRSLLCLHSSWETQLSNDTTEKPQYHKKVCHQINVHGFHRNEGSICASEIPICPKYFNWNRGSLLTAESNSYYWNCGLLSKHIFEKLPNSNILFASNYKFHILLTVAVWKQAFFFLQMIVMSH